ncbi:uncharacterized protein LOC114732343 isoform X2 [Neltuma alba]|uniref:uncharacterized protein LOC114732343 isoform X2 n=1 Tax=Neltuma alba TaxID=207710 RepID=UPI0010A326CC|nr:uncharacterized protein LOC114732343 isoform X2 [Prosopis alba]
MASPIAYSQIDDKDLDDAALWAVIDSATASRSATKYKSLAIKYNNSTSPSPISKPLPPTKVQRIARDSPSASIESKATGDGEVDHEPWSFRPPRKVARICSSETSESSPLVPVKNGQRTPPVAAFYSSPEAHLSPEIGRLRVQEISPYTEVSPGHSGRSEEKEITTHGFSGKFPSVSLFKEYQNTAMAILEKTDYTLISGKPFIKKSGWRKISCFFNISFEIRDKNIEFDENRNVQRAEFVARAYMQYVSLFEGVGSLMVGALVSGVRSDFRNRIMTYQARQRLEPKTKRVKTY